MEWQRCKVASVTRLNTLRSCKYATSTRLITIIWKILYTMTALWPNISTLRLKSTQTIWLSAISIKVLKVLLYCWHHSTYKIHLTFAIKSTINGIATILVMICKIILVVCFRIESGNIWNWFIWMVFFRTVHVDADKIRWAWYLLRYMMARISVNVIKILSVVFRVIVLIVCRLLLLAFSTIVQSGLG